MTDEPRNYIARSARDADGHYDRSYCDYLEAHAHELHAYYLAKGDPVQAEAMLTRTLSQSLMGNDGD